MGQSVQHLGLLLALLASAAAAAHPYGRHMLAGGAGGCDTSCASWQLGGPCTSFSCQCVNGAYQVTWSAVGTAGGTDCKASISWACCIKGNNSLEVTADKSNRCGLSSCTGTDAGSGQNYCKEVSSITYTVPATETNAIFYLHDGQFAGTVPWAYNGNSNSPCGGGGNAGTQCTAVSTVCEVRVPLFSTGGSASAGCTPGCGGGGPQPGPTIQSPSPEPTASPSPQPTASPSPEPTIQSPSPDPTASPSPQPTASPSPQPTASPSPGPMVQSPSPQPTASPSPQPTASPSPQPTASPSPQPTASPSPQPIAPPTVTCSTPVPFTCPLYTSAAPGSADISPPYATACCQASCGNYLLQTSANPAPYPCEAGSSYDMQYAYRTNPTQNRCCSQSAPMQPSPSPDPIVVPQQETCSWPTLYQCPLLTTNKASAADLSPRVAPVCCVATCGNWLVQTSPNPDSFPCQPGTNFVPGFAERPNPSQEVCCTPNPNPTQPVPSPSPVTPVASPNPSPTATCGNTQPNAVGAPVQYRCPVYTTFNDAASGATNPSSTTCCLPQCGNYLAQDVANPETFPCSPGTVFSTLWASRDNPSQSRCCEVLVAPESAADCSITSQGLDNLQMKVGQEVDVVLTVKILWVDNIVLGAEEVKVTNQLPGGLEYVGSPLTDPDCSYVANRMTCDLHTLPADAVKSFKVKVRATTAGSYANRASVSCKGDKILENNKEEDKLMVLGACCDARPVAASTNYCSFRTAAACQSIGGTFKADKTCEEASCPTPEPPAKATCADSQPSAAGAPVQYKCAPGTTFNAGNADKAPGPGVCCLATCSNTDVKAFDQPVPFVCTGDYYSNPKNALANPPTRDVCCKKDININPNDVPDVGITKKILGPSTVQVGDQIQFELKVALVGLAPVTNVVVVDSLPQGLQFKSVTPDLQNCKRAGQEVKCTFKLMDDKTPTQTITITAIATEAGSYTNLATVTGDNDSDPKNNKDTEPFTVLGSCCSRGKLTQRAEASCTQVKGTFYSTTPAKQIRCSTPSGSCCQPDGTCSIETSTMCKQLGGKWSRRGKCSSVSCPKPTGACCISSLGICLETTKDNCAGVWSMGVACASSFCPQVCKQPFQPCNPGTDTCCDGSTCKPIPTPYPGCSVQYACQPTKQCSGEGQPCGDCNNGGACCAGLECKWDWWARQGTCQKPKSSCKKYGDSCSSDGECCSGHRCGKENKVISCDCNRSCNGDYSCEVERKKDCAVLQKAVTCASAATRH